MIKAKNVRKPGKTVEPGCMHNLLSN